MTRSREGHLAMLLFSALVAGSFSLGGRIANEIDPMAVTAVRFWLATALIGGITVASVGVPRSALVAPWRYGVLGGLFAIYFVLMFWGLRTAPPVSASAVFTLMPPMAAGFGWLLLRQRATGRVALGLVVGGAGALWVIFRGDLGSLAALEVGRGEAIYLAGCVAHALYAVLVPRLNRGEAGIVFTLGVLGAGSVILTLLGWPALRATDWGALPVLVWVTLAYLAVFATAASFVLLQFASMRLPASRTMAYTYLTPSWVILWEVALGGALPGKFVLGGIGLSAVALLILLRDDALKS
jgi:drug/metabolite transporter (DMT)-like permease